jgi:hypothetical protein
MVKDPLFGARTKSDRRWMVGDNCHSRGKRAHQKKILSLHFLGSSVRISTYSISVVKERDEQRQWATHDSRFGKSSALVEESVQAT